MKQNKPTKENVEEQKNNGNEVVAEVETNSNEVQSEESIEMQMFGDLNQ